MNCLKCGACCRWVILYPKKEEEELFPLRNAIKVNQYWLVPVKCQRLDGDLCSNYRGRPQICQDAVPGNEICRLCREADKRKEVKDAKEED